MGTFAQRKVRHDGLRRPEAQYDLAPVDVALERDRFDPDRPWQKHQWRPATDGAWRDVHRTQKDEWGAFELARTLDETAAKLSVSMGLPRIMGLNHAAIGYESVGQMFDAFSASERHQLLGFFDFVSGPFADSRRLSALQAQDFDAFAALHNGSHQAARYGSMIRSAFEAFQRLNPGV